MNSSITHDSALSDTKIRILSAVESLFVESGYEGMSLRQISSRAGVNLAAVHYHFGGKEALIQTLLALRLDRMHSERIKLLERFEANFPGDQMTCEHVLGAMFIPALRMTIPALRMRSPGEDEQDEMFLRFLGRAYTDPSPVVRDFLAEHYTPISSRIFEAFLRTLPHLTREELGCRLHFAMGALASVLAGNDTQRLIKEFSGGSRIDDLNVISRLASLMIAALKAPMTDSGQLGIFADMLADAEFPDKARGTSARAAKRTKQTEKPVKRPPSARKTK